MSFWKSAFSLVVIVVVVCKCGKNIKKTVKKKDDLLKIKTVEII